MMKLRVRYSRNLYWIKRVLVGRVLLLLLIITIIPHSFAQKQLSNDYGNKTFNVGLKIVDFEYKKPNGKKEILTTAIWYPTDKQSSLYTYQIGFDEFKSKIAVNAPVAKRNSPFPLIVFSHGGFATAYNYAILMEGWASEGFIVVAPDYIDYINPPDLTKQAAFGRIKNQEGIDKGIVMRPGRILMMIGSFVKWLNANREDFLSWLTEGRIRPTTFIIDRMLELNRENDSPFYRTMDERAIGVAGHSGGGTSILGLVGGHPDKSLEDKRIKAALLLSSGVYPFEDNIGNIHIPLMIMAGDNDAPANPDVPRKLAYIRANSPKYYLILKDSTHFSFGNKACESNTLLGDFRQSDPKAKGIWQCSSAFFNRYLKNDISAQEQLNKSDPAWAYYKMEEKLGDVREWGKEPPPTKGGPGGIRGEFGKGRDGGRWLRRWRER